MGHQASASTQILFGMCILDLSSAILHDQIQVQPINLKTYKMIYHDIEYEIVHDKT